MKLGFTDKAQAIRHSYLKISAFKKTWKPELVARFGTYIDYVVSLKEGADVPTYHEWDAARPKIKV